MPRVCNKVKLPGGGVAIITTSTHVNPNDPCGFCGTRHTALCDFPIRKGKDTKRYTCSKRLCDGCKSKLGDSHDLCPPHAVLIDDHGLRARLLPLLTDPNPEGHRVALDMIDQVLIKQPLGWRPKNLADWHEFFTERAAMFEYLGEMPRIEAERRARALAGERSGSR